MRQPLCLLVFLAGFAFEARAQSIADEAEAQFQLGVRAYQNGNQDASLVHFMQSNRLSPNHNTAANVGNAFVVKRDYPAAHRWYAMALELAPEDDKAGIQAAMDRILDKVHLVELSSNPPGARVYIDRVERGLVATTPATIALPVGSYTFIMTMDDHERAETERIEFSKVGETSGVSIDLKPIVGQIVINGPKGATVRLERTGEAIGTLPLVAGLKPTPSVLLIEQPGFETKRIIVSPVVGTSKSVDVMLEPLTGQVEVQSSTVGSRIEIDGELAGFTPRLLDLPIGPHDIVVRNRNSTPYVDTINVSEGTSMVVNARLTRQLTVVSASNRAETLDEAPAPVTVITSEMLRNSGVRNLQEALTLFVPGMTVVTDHNELNVAMRGVYASSQQKILIMRDGHRLNSRAYSMANPDFSIMIDPHSVQQIEVVRGPGSSVYGNVALTAVVNIVTRPTNASEGPAATARVTAGNYGQVGASGSIRSLVTPESTLEAWASIFRAEGELVPISIEEDYNPEPRSGVARIGGVERPASYDIGARFNVRGFTAHLQGRFGKHTEPFTGGGATGQVYDATAIPDYRGLGPGLGSFNQHLSLSYEVGDDELSGSITAYGDTNEIRGMLATSPVTGLVINWREYDVGTIAQAQANWDLPSLGQGGLAAGFQLETTSLYDSFSLSSADLYDAEVKFGDPEQQLLLEGSEQTYAAFGQMRQALGSTLLINLGARADYKLRRPGDELVEAQDPILAISPRFALNWSPVTAFDLKASFAGSFVDAPYWYRYTSLPTFAGAVGLEPELLRAVQITPSVNALDNRLRLSVNAAYNEFSQLTFRDNTANPELGEPYYRSSGALKTWVGEFEGRYVAPRISVHGNATYQYVMQVDDYTANGNRIENVPSLVGNLQTSFNVANLELGSLWLGGAARYRGQQSAPIRGVSIARPDAEVNLAHELAPYALFDLTGRVEDLVTPGLSLDLTVTNVLNQRWYQGGSTLHPYPMASRWVHAAIQYDFGGSR